MCQVYNAAHILATGSCHRWHILANNSRVCDIGDIQKRVHHFRVNKVASHVNDIGTWRAKNEIGHNSASIEASSGCFRRHAEQATLRKGNDLSVGEHGGRISSAHEKTRDAAAEQGISGLERLGPVLCTKDVKDLLRNRAQASALRCVLDILKHFDNESARKMGKSPKIIHGPATDQAPRFSVAAMDRVL
ncbi:hypothetical protein HG530_012381 [Fusarium avenaceum]|nr:hypothetical protein HG530_012381 [Fusarium avenaceum]